MYENRVSKESQVGFGKRRLSEPSSELIFINESQTGDMWGWNFFSLMRTFIRAQMPICKIIFLYYGVPKGAVQCPKAIKRRGNKTRKKKGKNKKEI